MNLEVLRRISYIQTADRTNCPIRNDNSGSAFDTLRPDLLAHKLVNLNINPYLIKWLHSLLTSRPQQVVVNGVLSCSKHSSMGVPQGGVCSPLLFTAYTNDFRSNHPKNHIVKFSDDTVVLSLLCVGDDPMVYFQEVSSFVAKCEENSLILNSNKTKEIIFDLMTNRAHDPVVIGECSIEQVSSYKYLGVQLDNLLKWNIHVDYLCSKLAQRLHFLRRLRVFGVSTNIMLTFYNAVLGSLIRYSMAAWYGSLSVQLKNKVNNMVKLAMKVMGLTKYPPLQSIYEDRVTALARSILRDPSHFLFAEYELLPSRKRFRAKKCKSNRYKQSFIPSSVTQLNKHPLPEGLVPLGPQVGAET